MRWQLVAKLRNQLELIIYALREAFVSLIPFLVLSSIATLLLQVLPLWGSSRHLTTLHLGAKLMQDALPVFLLIAISFQLSKLKNIDSAGAITLSVALLITIFPFKITLINAAFSSSSFSVFSILIPVVSTLNICQIFKLQMDALSTNNPISW